MINLFPYTDAHELNLDWVVKQVKANNTKVKDLTHTVENLHFDFDSKADKATTYTKTEVDTLLNAKADTSNLAAVATSGNYNDLINNPTIPAAQVNSDWNANSGVAQILNKPTTIGGYGITNAYTKTQVDNAINAVTPQTLTFTETTNAQGSFYIGNLTNLDSIILQVYTTENYFYLVRSGGSNRWVALCVNGLMQPVANVEVHVTVKYVSI